MFKFYLKWEKYFLSEYDEYPSDIKLKMRNLLFINFVYLGGWLFIFILDGFTNYLMDFNILNFLRDFIVLGLIIISFLLIRNKKPIMAGNCTGGVILTIILEFIIIDLRNVNPSSILNLYKTLGFLLFGNLFIILISIKRMQVLIYSGISFFSLLFHSHMLIYFFFGEGFSYGLYDVISEVLFLLLVSTIISYYIFSLTLRSRIGIIDNIIFYKMTSQGPQHLFSEHPIDYNLAAKSGIYFYTAVGQGIFYRTGLFGPLPFGDKEGEIALIYSALLDDSSAESSRMQGKNYIIMAFIAKEIDIDLIDRNKFSDLISSQLQKIGDLSTFKKNEFKEFVRTLRVH